LDEDPTVLLVQDAFGLEGPEMEAATANVNGILRPALIRTEWHLCQAPGVSTADADPMCAAALPDGVLVVRIASATRAVPSRSLGSALVNGSQGSLATVYADRVRSLAAHARVDKGLLLGRAIAHELAHLLIGTVAHSKGGLMRRRWTVAQIQRDLPGDWTLSRQDLAGIARGLEVRARRVVSRSPALAKAATTNTPGVSATCRANAECGRQ
jgi:hypothetical protein